MRRFARALYAQHDPTLETVVFLSPKSSKEESWQLATFGGHKLTNNNNNGEAAGSAQLLCLLKTSQRRALKHTPAFAASPTANSKQQPLASFFPAGHLLF